jgi:hypothetical protein
MSNQVFRIDKENEYLKAGPTDLIQLLPTPNGNPLFILKWQLQSLVDDIVAHDFIHISGPTGSAKSSLIEALCTVQDNFHPICAGLGLTVKPVRMFPVEMAVYETPGELYQRRAINNGTTYDEPSHLVQSLLKATENSNSYHNVIWLREMGRVHASSVQGGLLNLMTHDNIILSDGTRLNGRDIAWIADSNYQAAHESTHTLVTLDDALRRRFGSNLTMDYLSGEMESIILEHLSRHVLKTEVNAELIAKVTKLGRIVRRYRNEGALQSLVPPTIYGYLAFLRKTQTMPELSHQQVAQATLLGNASQQDQELLPAIQQEVFGIQDSKDVVQLTTNLF